MEAKQISKYMAISFSSLLIGLFCSRAVYNVIAVGLDLDSIPVGYDRPLFATDLVSGNPNPLLATITLARL